jgi:DNA polymerase
MELICLDFETFYSADYTLSKMTTEAYVRDPRFEALCLGFARPDGAQGHVPQENLRDFLGAIDWANTAVVAHHAQFDGLIFSHYFGVRPAYWFDTLSMARQVHGNHLSVSLASLAAHYGLAPKSVPYDLFKGKRWADLDPYTRQLLGDGAAHDCALTMQIFGELMKTFPREELLVVDTTIRMFTEPALIGDQALFETIRDREFLAKNEVLYALDVGEKDLQSADKFCALLEREGVDIVYKRGPPTKTYPDGRDTPAIAKTDQFMRDLCDDPNSSIATLAQARLDVRSTLDETRCGRLAGMSSRGQLPVYLSYCGAHTTRWSGGDKVNLQNLPRGPGIRQGLKAPPGFLFAAVDQEQGECRMVNWLAGQEDVLERFRRGEDVYLPMASSFYGRPITKADKQERQLGKVLELMGGFGGGGPKIVSTLKNWGVHITQEEGMRARDTYRSTHPAIVAYWKEAERMLIRLAAKEASVEWGPMTLDRGKIYLPNGGWLDFTSLEWHADPDNGDRYWRLKTRRGYVKYYGAKLVENVVQALSRAITSQAMIRVRQAGYRVVGMAHDDFWYLIPDDVDAAQHIKFGEEAMSFDRPWTKGLPLAAAGKAGETYA